MILGDILKEYRSKNNLSMDKFAELSGLTKGYI
ncbi:XRE family transcriptional regulator, partial [Streptococcus suis]